MIDIGMKVNPYSMLALIVIIFVGTLEVIYYGIVYNPSNIISILINLVFPEVILEKITNDYIFSWIWNIFYWMLLFCFTYSAYKIEYISKLKQGE